MSQAPYMPVFTDALLGDTTHLTAEEFGSYCLILFATWRNNGVPFPDDDIRLRRITRCHRGRWRRLRAVLVEFFDLSDGTWRQKRLEKVWQRTAEYLTSQRDKSEQAVAARWSKVSSVEAVTEDHSRQVNELKSLETALPAGLPTKENPKKKKKVKILRGESGVAPLPSPTPPTPDEIVEVEALVEQATTMLQGGVAKGIRDADAYQDAIKTNKFTNLVKKLNAWAGSNLDGEAQWAAWEVLAAAQDAGARAGMERAMRKNFDTLARMYRATEPSDDEMEIAA